MLGRRREVSEDKIGCDASFGTVDGGGIRCLGSLSVTCCLARRECVSAPTVFHWASSAMSILFYLKHSHKEGIVLVSKIPG